MQVSQSNKTCCAPEDGALAVIDQASAVDFSGDRRVHISMNVRNVERSLPFYRALFNQAPIKLRNDYAKFEIADPSINFTINQHPDSVDRDGHFGIEVKDTDAVMDTLKRLKTLGVTVDATETQVACCYSVQDKIWAADPDGNHWEVFVVTANESEAGCSAGCICYDPATDRCKWD